MATGLLETGPKLDWTRDNKIFDHFQIWKEKVELIFSSALEESSSKQKVSYLRYWMGEQGIPFFKIWTAIGKLDFSSAEEDALSSGYILQNYWNLLDLEFRPKGNKLAFCHRIVDSTLNKAPRPEMSGSHMSIS